jgi:ribose transport system substrate-binding protein
VAADPAEYSPKAADAMAEKIGCQGPVAITQNALSTTENAVADYFRAELLAKCPGIEILETQMEGIEPSGAAAVDAAILAAHPDLKGAYSTTGGGPTSWSTAAKEAGLQPGELTIISMDYSAPNLALVDSGWVYALVGQPIYEEYYHAVELLLAAIKGEPVPYDNLMQAKLIFKENTKPYIAFNCRAGNLTGDACK